MIPSTLHFCLQRSLNGARNSLRSYSNSGANIFNWFKREKLQYREERGYDELVESRNSYGKSTRDVSELHDIIPEEHKVPGSDKTEDP